jgi:hypothetical protein
LQEVSAASTGFDVFNRLGGLAMRHVLVVLWMMLCAAIPATAQVSIGFGSPHVSIGINLSLFPELVPVPGYPVYYAPQVNSNYFFYDGLYWVFQGDNWYASSWYNGPWQLVVPEEVPLFVLRIPVRYYRHPPGFFRGWQANASPHWGEHWGNDWTRRREGWDRWDRNAAPAPAPLPVYQRSYSGDRYPGADQQRALQSRNYRYQPRDPVVRQHYQAPAVESAPAAAGRGTQGVPQERSSAPQGSQRAGPPGSVQESAPAAIQTQRPPRGSENVERSAPMQAPVQRRGPPVEQPSQAPQREAVQQRRQPEPNSRGEEAAPEGRGSAAEGEREQGSGEERGRKKQGDRGQDQRN